MQMQEKINGRDALVNYVKVGDDGGLIPVKPEEAEFIKIIFLDNGERLFATTKE